MRITDPSQATCIIPHVRFIGVGRASKIVAGIHARSALRTKTFECSWHSWYILAFAPATTKTSKASRQRHCAFQLLTGFLSPSKGFLKEARTMSSTTVSGRSSTGLRGWDLSFRLLDIKEIPQICKKTESNPESLWLWDDRDLYADLLPVPCLLPILLLGNPKICRSFHMHGDGSGNSQKCECKFARKVKVVSSLFHLPVPI